MLYRVAGMSLNVMTSFGRVHFEPLFVKEEGLRRAWVRSPLRLPAPGARSHQRPGGRTASVACRLGLAVARGEGCPAPLLRAQALAARCRRTTWLDNRRWLRDSKRWDWEHRGDLGSLPELDGHEGGSSAEAQGPLVAATRRAVSVGLSVGDRAASLWDTVLARTRAGAACGGSGGQGPCLFKHEATLLKAAKPQAPVLLPLRMHAQRLAGPAHHQAVQPSSSACGATAPSLHDECHVPTHRLRSVWMSLANSDSTGAAGQRRHNLPPSAPSIRAVRLRDYVAAASAANLDRMAAELSSRAGSRLGVGPSSEHDGVLRRALVSEEREVQGELQEAFRKLYAAGACYVCPYACAQGVARRCRLISWMRICAEHPVL